ncbi:MAG: hypothetical protein QM696_09305 [Steroidobacteraceae bacterium]
MTISRKHGGITMDGDARSAAGPQWLAGQWFTDEALEPLAEINAQCLDLLCAMAQADALAQPRMLAAQPQVWRMLSPQARLRLAASPYLLADAGFNDEVRWQAMAARAVRDLPREFAESAFTGAAARDFIRRVLIYSWHLVRAHRQVARLVFGMTPACAALLAGLRLKDLDWLAEQQPGWVRPRWETQPLVWRHLLQAAAEDDHALLTQASLRGIQLLAAACVPADAPPLRRPRQAV